MSSGLSFLERIRLRRMRGFWLRRTRSGKVSDALRVEAGKLRRILEEAERSSVAGNYISEDPREGLPGATLWATRPDPWSKALDIQLGSSIGNGTQIAKAITLYHDGNSAQIFLRQAPASEENSSAFSLSFDIASFDGNYLSLALGFPADEIQKIQKSDLIRLDLLYTAAVPVVATARANIKIGPNVEKITREIDRTRAKSVVEFDLFYAELDSREIEDVWVDLIFERPSTNVITINDLRLSRRPRAKA